MNDSDLEEGELIESFENSNVQFGDPNLPMKRKNSFQRQKRPRGEEKTKKVKCKYWATGTCNRGQECPYLHEGFSTKEELGKYVLPESAKDDKSVYSHDTRKLPCKYFHGMGACHAGESCKFSHAAIPLELHPKFRKDNEKFLMKVHQNLGYNSEMFFRERMPSLLPYPYPPNMWLGPQPRPPSPDLLSRLNACGIVKLKNIPMPPPELVKKRTIPDRKQLFKLGY